MHENCVFLCSAVDKNESGKHQGTFLYKEEKYDHVCDSQSEALPLIISENIKRRREVW